MEPLNDTFFAASHAIDPDQKDSVWAAKIMYEYYYYGGAQSLLEGKKPKEIRSYVAGSQDVAKFRRMFRKAAAKASNDESAAGGTPAKDLAGIDWEPLALLTQPFNSALAILQKMPIYIKCTAIDALARELKDKDAEFLRNRPYLDASLAQFSQKLGARIDPPAAPNNSAAADISAFDLNPMVEDELSFYMNMFYKLRPESAFEEVLQALAYIYELRKVRDLENRDQLYYGVSANRAFFSDITGLPGVKYLYPGDVYTPPSDLPDSNDQDFRYVLMSMTANEVMDLIGSEIDEALCDEIFDRDWVRCGKEGKWSEQPEGREKASYRINLCYFEFKSPDAIRIHKKKKSNGNYITEVVPYGYRLRYSRNHPDAALRGKDKEPSDDEHIKNKWAQNTYTGYYFPCWVDDVFNFKKLESAYREPGREALSPFSINIWRSQDKGAAELCIPLVDQAQKAVYKMQHALVMSRPKGMFIDTKYMRQAVNNLVNTDMPLGMKDLYALLIDDNIFLGDSEGLDPLELEANTRPYYEIPGGVSAEIEGYLAVINDCILKIQRITGWNDALTGQTPSSDALVGVQKLMLQSAINSLYYAQNAQKYQTEKVFKSWCCQVQWILKNKNSASAQALESILSTYKIDVIRDMQNIPLHQFGIMVENTPTEEEQQELNMMLMQGYQQGRLTGSDYVTLKRIFNYKDAAQLMAIRERKSRERAQQASQQAQEAAMQEKAMEEQGKAAATKYKVDGDLRKEITKGDVQKWLAEYTAQTDAALMQLQGQMKAGQQQQRIEGQLQKVDKQNDVNTQKPVFAAA